MLKGVLEKLEYTKIHANAKTHLTKCGGLSVNRANVVEPDQSRNAKHNPKFDWQIICPSLPLINSQVLVLSIVDLDQRSK